MIIESSRGKVNDKERRETKFNLKQGTTEAYESYLIDRLGIIKLTRR
jgi:hypothetical protein